MFLCAAGPVRRILLKCVMKVIVVIAAARISLIGSAASTADKDQRDQEEQLTQTGQEQADLCRPSARKLCWQAS